MISGVRDDTEDLYTGTTTRTEAVVNEIVFKEIVMRSSYLSYKEETEHGRISQLVSVEAVQDADNDSTIFSGYVCTRVKLTELHPSLCAIL